MYSFGENLRHCRLEAGLSQRQLAKKMGVSQGAICFWENALRYPTLDRVFDISRVLGVEVAELLEGEYPQNFIKGVQTPPQMI